MDETSTCMYGPNEHQFVRIHHPSPSCTRDSIVFAIIHGGYFKAKYGIDNSGVSTLVPMLLGRGYSVAMIEYRRVGHPGGGWPGSNMDIINALNIVYESAISRYDRPKIVVVGHSAGGTLALWSCASRSKEPYSSVIPHHHQDQDLVADEAKTLRFPVALCIAVAPIGDLEAGYHRRLSDEGDAVTKYMGNSIPSEASDVCPYKLASPHHLLPITTPLLVAIGTADKDVPPDLVREFYDRVAAAPAPASLVAAGRENHTSTAATCSNTAAVSAATAVSKAHPALLMVIPDADHFDVMTAGHPAWSQILEAAEQMLGLC